MTTSIYGCYDSAPRDPAATYPVQDGWKYRCDPITRTPIRVPVIIQHVNPMSVGCQYTIRTPDRHCDGCRQAER